MVRPEQARRPRHQVRRRLVLPAAPRVRCRQPERAVQLHLERSRLQRGESAHVSRSAHGPGAGRLRLLREGDRGRRLRAGQVEDQRPADREPRPALRRRDRADRRDGQLPLLGSARVSDRQEQRLAAGRRFMVAGRERARRSSAAAGASTTRRRRSRTSRRSSRPA